MIKFFRHIRKKMLLENKSSKYLKYAFGEIFLVVVGILIALQVSNWNEDRKLRSREEIYLKTLHEEFISNKSQFEEVIKNHYDALKSCNQIINLFPIEITESLNDSLQSAFNHIYKRYTFNPTQGTINALINSSSIELISNETLRQLLMQWNDIVEDYQEEEKNSVDFARSYLEVYSIKNFQWDGNINDPRFDKNILKSLEFENIIRQRQQDLLDILESSENEKETVQETIDKIIALTKT
jgi:Family of unknown function (DUF6090)